MGNRAARWVAILLLTSFCFSGCAYMSAQGRREMAYRHYVNKHVRQRQKQIAKAQKASTRKMKHDLKSQPALSDPVVTSRVEPAERVSPPITVSSSNTTEAPAGQPAP